MFYKEGKKYQANNDKRLFADINMIPFPDYSLVDHSQIDKFIIQTQRGCPMACNYCPYYISQGLKFRNHNPEKMVEQFNVAGEAIEKSKDSMTIIAEKLENVPKITEQVKDILETNQNQISNLEGQLDAFSKMKENATEAMPLIEKRLNDMTEVLNNSINGQMDNIKTLNDNMKTNIESSNESIKNAIYEQLATIKTVNEQTQESIDASNKAVQKSMEDQMNTVNQVNENMKNSIETSNEAIKNAIQGVVDETSQKLVQQIEALDKQMSEELSRALELMGSKLTSLSNQFVKDYEPLTKQLSNLVQSLNQRGQAPPQDTEE